MPIRDGARLVPTRQRVAAKGNDHPGLRDQFATAQEAKGLHGTGQSL